MELLLDQAENEQAGPAVQREGRHRQVCSRHYSNEKTSTVEGAHQHVDALAVVLRLATNHW